ncbi:MAG: hypothetical protein ACFFBR_11635, partial [Promethearchaeota archaeon]
MVLLYWARTWVEPPEPQYWPIGVPPPYGGGGDDFREELLDAAFIELGKYGVFTIRGIKRTTMRVTIVHERRATVISPNSVFSQLAASITTVVSE